ncbi:MAG: hypothetical protein ACTTJW_00010 [Sphaerochaeta sp.]
MITLSIKNIEGNETLIEKELSHTSIQDGQVACFLAELEYQAIPLVRNNLYRVTITSGEATTLNNQICEYMTRQFNVSSYVDDEGQTKEGVTNNNLIFRLFS